MAFARRPASCRCLQPCSCLPAWHHTREAILLSDGVTFGMSHCLPCQGLLGNCCMVSNS